MPPGEPGVYYVYSGIIGTLARADMCHLRVNQGYTMYTLLLIGTLAREVYVGELWV